MVPVRALVNPERGFHLEANYFVHNLKNPFHRYTYPQGWLGDLNDIYHSQGDGISVVQLYLYLSEYVGKSIPDSAMNTMQMLFDDAREHGCKFVLRFAYDNTYGATNASFSDVFRHLDQLGPFIKKNLGLIDIWQVGFIGAWGEGHSSPMAEDYPGRAQLTMRILDMLEGRQTTIRLPGQKNQLNCPGEYKARMGYNNDYFTASQHPKAPGNDFMIGTPDYQQVKRESPHLKVIGEIPYAEQTEWGLHFLISVPKTLQTLRDHHYSLFDITQNNALNIAHWKTYPLYPDMLDSLQILYDASYFLSGGKPCSRSAYDFIRDHLGYRLYMRKEGLQLKTDSGKLHYRIALQNTGFSAIHNPREVYLVLIDQAGEVRQEIPLQTDPATWQPFQPDSQHIRKMTHLIQGHATTKLKGLYQIGLWMPDATAQLRYDGRYAVVFANQDLRIWSDPKQQYRVTLLGALRF